MAKRGRPKKVKQVNVGFNRLYFNEAASWYINPPKPSKPKPTQFVALYNERVKNRCDDTDFDDAYETFTSRKEVLAWLKSDKNASEIKIFEVKRQYKPRVITSLLKVKK